MIFSINHCRKELCLTTKGIAKVVPVYKKDDNKNLINYRPIALLPIFSKILEKLVYKRLNEFLLKRDILIPQQFGFRKHFSTSMSVFNLLNSIIKSFDDGNFCIFLNPSWGYDDIYIFGSVLVHLSK